jgi:mono/diheme cytochrome c family protein
MTQINDPPRQPQRTAIILTVLVGAIATAVAYFGSWEKSVTLPSPQTVTAGPTPTVKSIVLPYDETELPAGPHQRTFAVNCTICHSTRLVMTQPPLARKKWGEVVQKMIKTYGAPIHPDEAEQIADYLAASHSNKAHE